MLQLNKNGKQYDFNSSTEIISEFEALDLELIQLKVPVL